MTRIEGEARHIPVLAREAVAALDPKPHGRYLDATFGAGGYTRLLLETQETRVLALDRDPAAISAGFATVEDAGGRLILVEARFSELETVAAQHDFLPLNGAVFDVGVSSMQFDEAERGFSLRQDGPLDMRMEARGPSAADLVNEAEEEALADILYFYGEERAARRIARAIAHDRKLKPFTSTMQLAALIQRVAPSRPGDHIHPATKSFQALRIAVNNELVELVNGLQAAERALAPGGRLAVVTFHSLEDRIVKQFFTERAGRGETFSRRLPGELEPERATFVTLLHHPATPSAAEIAANPRARSAKLRSATRTNAPPRAADARLAKLAELPQRHARKG